MVLSDSKSDSAYTLSELMVSIALFSIVAVGTLSAHMFGLKMFQTVTPKLIVSDDTRQGMTKLIEDVQSAKSVAVGKGTISTFNKVPMGAFQVGNALRITNLNRTVILYYYDISSGALRRTVDGINYSRVLSHSINNSNIFSAEGLDGTVLTNDVAYPLIGVKLQLRQSQQSDSTMLRTKSFYQWRTKIYPRTE